MPSSECDLEAVTESVTCQEHARGTANGNSEELSLENVQFSKLKFVRSSWFHPEDSAQARLHYLNGIDKSALQILESAACCDSISAAA